METKFGNGHQRTDGYIQITSGPYKGKLLHRLIYEEVYGSIPKGYAIHHIDGDKTNNNPGNLMLLSKSNHHKLHFNMVNNQMERLQKKWNMLKSKQARLEQIKMMNVKNKNDVAACYDTLVRMEEANDGCIGKNQLHNLAEVKKLDFDDLYEFCMEKEFNIVEVAEPDVKKGARIRGMF